MKHPFEFGKYQFEFADTARRYESGSQNVAGIFALGGAVELILEVGVDKIAERILHLTDRLVTGLRDKSYRIVSSRVPSESSGIVSFISDVHDHEKVQQHLDSEHRIVISVRNGRLRASPYAYNSEDEIDQLIDRLPAP